MLCLVFGVPRGAARLLVASHPAWAAETAANDSDDRSAREVTEERHYPVKLGTRASRPCRVTHKSS